MCACNFSPLLSCGRRKRRSQCKWPDQITSLQTSSGDLSSAYERQIPKNLEQLSKWVISHTVKTNPRHQHPIYINLSFLRLQKPEMKNLLFATSLLVQVPILPCKLVASLIRCHMLMSSDTGSMSGSILSIEGKSNIKYAKPSWKQKE